MPNKDGTGPLGNGPLTGRGRGFCGQGNANTTTNAPESSREILGVGRGGRPRGGGNGKCFGGGRGPWRNRQTRTENTK